MLTDSLKKLFPWGPLFFGIGFIAPLIAQSLDASSLSLPIGLSNLQFGLAVGASWGLLTKYRGSWI